MGTEHRQKGGQVATLSLDGRRSLVVVVGDLLAQPVDAIVNAANGALAHGGGVAALIANRAGMELVREGDAIVARQGTIPVGEAVVTTAGKLPFQGVVHAVGPRQGEGDEERKLAAAVASALDRAADRGWTSVALPAISSGIFAVPLDVCARGYVSGVRAHVRDRPDSSLREVRLCLLSGPMVDVIQKEIRRVGQA